MLDRLITIDRSFPPAALRAIVAPRDPLPTVAALRLPIRLSDLAARVAADLAADRHIDLQIRRARRARRRVGMIIRNR